MPKPITLDDLLAIPTPGVQPKEKRPFSNVDELLSHPLSEQNSDNTYVKPGEFNLGTSIRSSFFLDPDSQLKAAAQSLFPNDPSAVDRFRFVGDRIAYTNPDGSMQYASSRGADFAGNLISNIPEMAGGALGATTASPVFGAALGVAGARGWKRAIAGGVYGEPQTIGGNLLDMGVNAGLEAATAGAAKGALAIGNRGRSIDMTPTNLAAAQAKREAINAATGVDVDLALASGDRRLLAVRNWLAQQPNETAGAIQRADEAAAGQFEQATARVLDQIATQQPSDALGRKGTNAAMAAIDSAKATRDAAVRPYYEAAGKVRLSADIVSDLNSDPLVARAARQVAIDPVFQRKLKGAPPDSVAYWQQVKIKLDAGYQAQSKKSRTVAAQYADASRSVNEKLAAASPEYALANQFFAEQTKKVVEPIESSVVGALAKVGDPKAASAGAKLFRDANIGPQDIVRARTLISKEDPEAWNSLVRLYVAREFNRAQRVSQRGETTNVPGKLYQSVWGDPTSKARMDAALGPEASLALKGLMETAETLAEAPVRGSNTQPNIAIQRVLEGPAAWWTRVLLNPRSSATQAATERAIDQNAAKLWEALSDPAKVRQLKIAVKIPDTTRRVTYVSAIILGQTGKVGVEEATKRQQ